MINSKAKGNFTYLLCGLLTLLLSSALAQQFAGSFGSRLTLLMVVFAIALSLFSISYSPRLFRAGILLAVIALINALISQFISYAVLDLLQLFLLGLFYFVMMLAVIRQVIFSKEINNNRIIGSVCLYLLLGLIWAVLFSFLGYFDNHAFNSMTVKDWPAQFSTLIYFSFVTLSTLGFGDITPASPLARFLVYTEALSGQFYLAILVASLIGAKFSRGQTEV